MAEQRKPAYAPGKRSDPAALLAMPVGLILAGLGIYGIATGDLGGLGLLFLALLCWLYARPDLRARIATGLKSEPGPPPALAPATAGELHQRALAAGGGAYLATGEEGEWIAAPPQSAVLVLAGPRAGKTSCVVIPALIAHPGAAVATSTKPEVLRATLTARQALGRAWFFDLQGHGTPPGTRALRWSPVTRAADWQQAQLVADAMTGSTDVDRDAAHWRERASALIACCLHAAARSGQGMREVSGWVLRHDPDSPLAELDPASIAADVLEGIRRTSDRERSSIFSTAARVLRAYRSDVALEAATEPNFDPDSFVRSSDTLYIAAPAHEQQLLAPLVVGLLTEIRQAAYRRAYTAGPAGPPLLFLLDECANIAPLPDLPAMLSEAGGQGLQTVVVLQDLSQARRRWPREADGLLSLFGARVILSGIADTGTLEQLSLLCGDWDRPVQTITQPHALSSGRITGPLLRATQPQQSSESWTTRRERQLPPDQIAQLHQGQALVMIGARWQLLATLPYHQHPTFAALAHPQPPQLPG